MGWASRLNERAGLPDLLRTRGAGLVVALDVQHLYRPSRPRDRGAVFTLKDGSHVAEAEAVLLYAQPCAAWLRARGVAVITNDPLNEILTGEYRDRQRAASGSADAYLALHLNAGRGSYAVCEYLTPDSAALADLIARQLDRDHPEILLGRALPLADNDRGAVCVRAFRRGPAVIVEPFFGDNPRHEALFAAPRLKQLGESIGAGLLAWWESVRPGRA